MTVNQGSALRRLDEVFEKALQTTEQNQIAGPVLLTAMKLDPVVQNLIEFYALMNKAKEEAESVQTLKLNTYLKVINELHHTFTNHHAWSTKWSTFVGALNPGVLATIDSLANSYHAQNPTFFIETEFLEKITEDLNSLAEEIIQSDLSPKLRNFLTNRIAEILKALRRHRIHGSEELAKTTKAAISDLVINKTQLEDTDKQNKTYTKFQARLLALYMWLVPTSFYDIIGAAPDIHDFWKPRIENMAEDFKKIEGIVIETATIQEAIEKMRNVLSNDPPQMIEGKNQKALPPGSESLDSTDDVDNQ